MLMSEASTGVPVVDTAVAWSLGIAAVCALLAMVWRAMRALGRIANDIRRIAEDVFGTEARPGVPARPGLVERVSGLESRVNGWERLLGRLLAGRERGEDPPEEGALAIGSVG